jgi:hypothetical protein
MQAWTNSKCLILQPFFLIATMAVIIIIIILYSLSWPTNVFALSPAFGRQEIANPWYHWNDMQSGEETNLGPEYTNIHSVTYSSDGRFLNSTLWFPSLSGLTSSNGKPSADVIAYGIMIDADLNSDSGFQGVDYELQISWNNDTKTWTQTLIEYASDGNSRRISPAADDTNFTGFTEKDKNYVKLDLDLKSILYPPRYRIFFYAYSLENNNKSWLLDAVRWIYVPPPEFSMSTSPATLDITAGDKGSIELNVNSTTGFQPTVYLNIPYLPANIGVEYENGNKTLKMPIYNVAKSNLVINSAANTKPGLHTVDVFGTVVFQPQYFKPPFSDSPIIINPENITTKTSFNIKVQKALEPLEKVQQMWNQIGGVFSFVYVPAVAIVGWVLTKHAKKRQERSRERRKSKHSNSDSSS